MTSSIRECNREVKKGKPNVIMLVGAGCGKNYNDREVRKLLPEEGF